MRQQFWKPTLLALAAITMTAMAPTLASADEHPDDHHVMRGDDHKDEHHDERRADDPAERYRHDHPHSSARCHDGFFTSTRDRGHACTKHGGIDVWLAL